MSSRSKISESVQAQAGTSTGAAVDPQSNQETPLFNPRRQVWREHFVWSTDGLWILGLMAVGCATIATLALNRERVINIREADKAVGRHPPADDPIQSRANESR